MTTSDTCLISANGESETFMRNEKSSRRVAEIAGRLLRQLKTCRNGHLYDVFDKPIVSIRELKALAASCLTQTPDKRKKRAA